MDHMLIEQLKLIHIIGITAAAGGLHTGAPGSAAEAACGSCRQRQRHDCNRVSQRCALLLGFEPATTYQIHQYMLNCGLVLLHWS